MIHAPFSLIPSSTVFLSRSSSGFIVDMPKIVQKDKQYPTEEFSLHTFCEAAKIDAFVRSHNMGRHSKKLQMQGARILRNEAYIEVRRSDER
jgi:hypothetical protein